MANVKTPMPRAGLNGKFAFVDMTPPRRSVVGELRPHQLKTQLVNEYLAWSAGRLKKLSTQKPKKNGYGLYAIRPQRIIAAPGMNIPSQSRTRLQTQIISTQ